MMTSTVDLFGNFGCGSTGMPRPLSVTVTQPSASSITSMKVAWAGDGFVHGIVEHLGEQVVHGRLVRPADVHAGSATDRLESLEHLDRRGGILGLRRCAGHGRLGAA